MAVALPLAPGPRGHWILGSTVAFREDPLVFCLGAQAEHGDLVHFRVAFMDWYLVAHPDQIHEVLVTRADEFWKSKLNKRIFEKFLGNGILSSDGAFWKTQQKMVRPGFHKERIDAYGQIMVQLTREMAEAWHEGESIDIFHSMTELTLAIVARCLFDADVKGDAREVGECMVTINDVLIEHIHAPIPVPRWWPTAANRRKIKAIDDMRGVIRRIITERRASGEDRGDLLSMLVFATDDDGDGMSPQQLEDEAMTLFFAGHETTALTLTWLWYLLAKHPEICARAQAELAEVLGGRDPGLDDMKSLVYLDQVIKEGMRILPSVWTFMRQPIEDLALGGHPIKKGANIFISPYVTHRDARWYPDPEQFIPERWTKAFIRALPKGAYIPFSAGPRVCLGKQFALMEARLVLAWMLQRLQPQVPADYEPVLMPQLALRPRDGMPSTVRFRPQPDASPTRRRAESAAADRPQHLAVASVDG